MDLNSNIIWTTLKLLKFFREDLIMYVFVRVKQSESLYTRSVLGRNSLEIAWLAFKAAHVLFHWIDLFQRASAF